VKMKGPTLPYSCLNIFSEIVLDQRLSGLWRLNNVQP